MEKLVTAFALFTFEFYSIWDIERDSLLCAYLGEFSYYYCYIVVLQFSFDKILHLIVFKKNKAY